MNKIQKTLFTFAYAAIIGFVIIISSVPPVSRDAQTHHLALPKIWLTESVLSVVPEMEFSYYPQLIDLLYYFPVALNFDIAAKYIHFLFALATAFLIFLFIRRYLNSFWGLLGGLMFLTLPLILKLSVTVYVDLGLLFFTTAALFSVIIWLEKPEKMKWLMIAGISCGLALSTKYNAMMAVTILALLFGYFYIKIHKKNTNTQLKIIKYLSIFSILTLLIFSPWAIRNTTLTGNPIYPLYDSFFSQFSENTTAETEQVLFPSNEEKMKPLTFRRLAYQENPIYSLALPLRVFYEGQDDNPKYFDGKLNPMLLLFALLLLLRIKSNWRHQFFASFVVITLLYTMFAVDMRIRYIITIVTPMIVLAVFGIHHISQWLKGQLSLSGAKAIIAVFLAIYFAFNLSYAVNLYKKIDPLPYILGEISKDDYISNQLPYYSLNQMANELVPQKGKLLGVYTGNRRYYLDIPHTLQSEMIFHYARNASDTNDLAQKLSNHQITHILVRVDLFNNKLSGENEEVKSLLLNFFKNNLKLLASKGRFSLFEMTQSFPQLKLLEET
ncbi:ArnT family glycosyltransferase [Marinicella rhabdoformis]|uniref:ArnT family glycosyltransferase n=1 Tax=Marinicella rhabdoformis TaxID=2580566 RepID=UPI0015D01D29|nr:glycosyltransferase family 39 protein [Marinicella rhabdoformis]